MYKIKSDLEKFYEEGLELYEEYSTRVVLKLSLAKSQLTSKRPLCMEVHLK